MKPALDDVHRAPVVSAIASKDARCGVSVPGTASGKGLYPLVSRLGVPVAGDVSGAQVARRPYEARDVGEPMAERTAWRICSD